MADVLAGLRERPLLVISSDMNHYADERETRRRDRMALEALAALDPERLYRTVREQPNQHVRRLARGRGSQCPGPSERPEPLLRSGLHDQCGGFP